MKKIGRNKWVVKIWGRFSGRMEREWVMAEFESGRRMNMRVG